MELLRTLNQKCEEQGIQYLLVGGHAVNVYGVSRQTGDLDLGVREADEIWWRETLGKLGFSVRHDQRGFVLFAPPRIDVWPIDLLIMNEKTFSGIMEAGRQVLINGVAVQVPSIEHLIAMKLHALRENWADRELKDLEDIRQLMKKSTFAVNSEEFRALCLKFGNDKIYDRLKEILSRCAVV